MPPTFDVSEAMYRKISCPVLMIHGDNDQLQPHARAQARRRGDRRRAGDLSGWWSQSARDAFPAKCNALIADFLDRKLGLPHPEKLPKCCKDEASALSVVSNRARPRSPRHRDHAGAAQTSPRSAGRLARAGPGHAVARNQRRDASIRSAADSPARRGTSNWNRASTISTLSRPSAGWTRC